LCRSNGIESTGRCSKKHLLFIITADPQVNQRKHVTHHPIDQVVKKSEHLLAYHVMLFRVAKQHNRLVKRRSHYNHVDRFNDRANQNQAQMLLG